jgi:hypothetical protein
VGGWVRTRLAEPSCVFEPALLNPPPFLNPLLPGLYKLRFAPNPLSNRWGVLQSGDFFN